MPHTLPQSAVVGEDDQPLAVCIQTPYIVGIAVLTGQQIVHGTDSTLSIAAAHIATRFIQKNGHFLLGRGVMPIHLDKIGRQNPQTGGIHHLTVDLHATFGNQTVGGSAGFITAGGEKLVETYAALGGSGIF